MMGMKERSFAPLINVSLEELVPHDHFYRHLERTLDLSFVREFVHETYAGGGRPSVDPIVFFKLQLVMFFEGIRSERLLMRHANDRLSVRWYLGYDLDEPLPDHSSLTRIRTRYGVEMFRRFFEAIVDQCQQAGLVWGKELYVDATKVNANASMESVKPRFAVDAHPRELFATEGKEEPERTADAEPCPTTSEAGTSPPEAIREEMMPTNQVQAPPTPVCEPMVTVPVPLPVSLDDATRQDLTRANEQRHDWIEQVGKPDREVVRGTYRRMADFVVSTTDPDATVMLTKGEGRHLGYHTHYVVDGGKARIIMAVLVTPSEVMENQPMLDLLWRTRFRWKLWPRQATGDTTYGTVDNIVALEHEHIRAYVPLPDFDQRTPFYGQREFQYDPGQDTYTCPNGATLRLKTHVHAERIKRYRADAATCNACPLKPNCTTSMHGRILTRSFDESSLDRVRAYHATQAYQKAMRKRGVWVEPLFAEGKDWHGMRRFRLRRLWRVNCEALVRRHSTPQQVALRARIILAADAGKNNSQIAQEEEVSVDTVRAWRNRWLALQGIALSDLSISERLSDEPRPGRPSQITAEQTCQMMALACEQPQERPISQWTGREIADEVMRRGILPQISPRHAARVLKKGISNRI